MEKAVHQRIFQTYCQQYWNKKKRKFDEAQICTGIFIKDNFKLKCKLLASDTCYKEDKRSNIWNSYECDSLIFNSTVQDNPCNSAQLFVWQEIKGLCYEIIMEREKSSYCKMW
jgi:hypothetical protein